MNPCSELISDTQSDTNFCGLKIQQTELQLENVELKRVQTELEVLHKHYFNLYELAPVGYFTLGENDTILEANLSACTMLGLPENAIVGQPITRYILPVDLGTYLSNRQILSEKGITQTIELRLEKVDASPFWARFISTQAEDSTGVMVHRLVIADINDSKRIKEKLHLSDVALKSISQGVLVITPHMLIVSVNPAFLAMTGYTEAELLGQNINLFNGQGSIELVAHKTTENTSLDKAFSDEVFTLRKDGSGFWNSFIISPIYDAQGELSHFISINTDISVRKSLSDILDVKNSELQEALTLAEKANMAKSEFLSSMSHDLRSPLNTILGFAQLLETGTPALTPLQRRNIQKILAGGWYLLRLINEILDLTVIESGKMTMSFSALNVSTLLKECKELNETDAEKFGIKINFVETAQPFWLIADAIRIKQVLLNLLSNAVKYNRPGGMVNVTVQMSASRNVRISVSDTGEGIHEDKLTQLFTSFNRLGQENTTTEGTGIGLVVTKKLTELMGGSIGVNSCVGVGSEFWIEFKSALTPEQAVQPDSRPSVKLPFAPIPFEYQPYFKVLYIEDSPTNVELVMQIVERRVHVQMLTTSNGLGGIVMAKQYRPDVILMDLNLPGMSGLEAMQILRQDALTLHIPVIAVSANAMSLDLTKGLSAGFFHYLTKPFEITHFLEVLDQALALSDGSYQLGKSTLKLEVD